MEKAIITPYIQQRPSSKRPYSSLRTVLALSLLVVCVYTGLFTAFRTKSSFAKVPINAPQIIQKCSTLNVIPGPPSDFGSRKESDRYVPGTNPTLIKNATIWTGNVQGLEIILGDLLLDKGMIQAVGEIPGHLLNTYHHLSVVDANGSWLSPGIVDLHSHLGDQSSPKLSGSADTNSRKGLVQPWLRSLDSLNTHDDAYQLSIAGGVTTAVILPGSANAIGGQAFVIKLRPTKERSSSSMLLEPPFIFNGTGIEEVQPPRWRQLKQACGENPSRVYSGTRMDTIWAYRQGYEEARKLKVKQDAYCEKASEAVAGHWDDIGDFPDDLQWEALVDVLRGKVKIQNHCYEAVDLDGIVRLTNEFKFPIAAFHHAHETYLVPDLLKKAYGQTPAVALFATKARYKRESYRGSEFAPRILAENEIQVVMKSDHPVLNSRFLLHEAQQAHYFGLASNLALASVTSTPAQTMGQGHRIGFIRKGYDADVVLWDSHPLAIGATPKQVFIDGIAQLGSPFVRPKSKALQHAPKTPNFEDEKKAALEFDGLPPLEPKESVSDVVIFQNFDTLFMDMGNGVKQVFAKDHLGAPQIAVVQNGKLTYIGASEGYSTNLTMTPRTVDLHGGSLAPGLLSYGSRLGLVHIAGEATTQDGEVFDILTDKASSVLGRNAAVIRAVDGLQFTTRDALLAYRSGVTTAVTAPYSSGLLAGLSTAFNTGAAHKLIDGAITQDEVALHVSLSLSSSVSVSTQIAMLRRLLSGGARGDLELQISKVLEGKIPLVVDVHNADIMASLIQLKSEIQEQTKSIIQMTFAGASEAHLLAREIGAAGVGVIVSPIRPFPSFWDMRRILPGPPLTQYNAITTLLANNVTVGVGVESDGAWAVRHTRFDVSWAAIEASGHISRGEAIALASSSLEKLLGLASGTVSSSLVATTGGTILDFESKVVAVASAKRGVVDLF